MADFPSTRPELPEAVSVRACDAAASSRSQPASRAFEQRGETQFPVASAAHEEVHSIGMDLVDDRLMRGEIDLRDGDGEVLPLNRSLLLRIVDFQIIDREVGGLDVDVESRLREVRKEVARAR